MNAPASRTYEHTREWVKAGHSVDEQLDNCQKFHAVIETNVTFSDDTVVRSDSMVICYEPEEKLTRTPELIFEVISKSTAKRDEILKFDLYQSEGVKYYILVYPDNRKAKFYRTY